ncbi:MAG: M28 family peptidase [Bacteroidota bacterium]
MELLSIIRTLEGKANSDRRIVIERYLQRWKIPFQIQNYSTGTNLIVKSDKQPFIGIGSHYDAVTGSPGANDNGSAMAVTLAVLKRAQTNPLTHFGVQGFFFDQEESGLLGSRAYVAKHGIKGMLGMINLELVGQGDQVAIWPVSDQDAGDIVKGIELAAKGNRLPIHRFDRIIPHDADHRSFREAGMKEAFSLTAISSEDLEVAEHYYRAMEFEVDPPVLQEILSQAPLFKHYHQATDVHEHLSESTLQHFSNLIWQALQLLDQSWEKDTSIRTFFQ